MNSLEKFIDENFNSTIHFNPSDNGTLIGLPYPYTVPCADEMFVEMYYWDTYFTNVGLLAKGNVVQAKNNADNMRYLINKYGYMPNGNRTFYLKHSQPPFYYKMVEDIFDITRDLEWLSESYTALKTEYRFWQTKRVSPNGLNIYGNHSKMDDKTLNKMYEEFCGRYSNFTTDSNEIKKNAAHTIKTMWESGWDCTSRFEISGEYYNPVDLNSLLYGFEKQMSVFAEILDNGEKEIWKTRAEERKKKMQEILFNEELGLYMDWNYKEKKFSPVISCASLYPLFVGILDNADAAMNILENRLILKYGVSACVSGDYKYGLQWDYPNIWAPLQYIAYMACINCKRQDIADRIASLYIELLESNFNETANLWEKYNGITGEVANADYNAPRMMGWTAGIYMFFKKVKGCN